MLNTVRVRTLGLRFLCDNAAIEPLLVCRLDVLHDWWIVTMDVASAIAFNGLTPVHWHSVQLNEQPLLINAEQQDAEGSFLCLVRFSLKKEPPI